MLLMKVAHAALTLWLALIAVLCLFIGHVELTALWGFAALVWGRYGRVDPEELVRKMREREQERVDG